MTSKPVPTLYPIKVVELPKPKPEGTPLSEVAAIKYFVENGYELIGNENHIYWGLWCFLCLDQLRIKPDWNEWDKNVSVENIPEIYDNLSTEGQRIAGILNYQLDYEYSAVNILANGDYATITYGAHYLLCKRLIDKHIKYLDKIDYIKLIKNNYWKYDSMLRRYYFRWISDITLEPVLEIAKLLPIKMIQFILTKFFENFYDYRTGFPDFTMQSKDNKKLKLVEVKGVREKIKDNQHYWLNKFVEHGVDASILRIKFTR